jgi:tetratricopeptide (TPR) repeat protein
MLDGKGEDLVLKIFTFEENMKQGKSVYAAEDFAKAQSCFESARSVYPRDFRVNFWLARTLVMQGRYAPALDKLQECRSLRPDLEAELLAEWMRIAMQEGSSKLSSINKTTDGILESLGLRKNIRLLNVVLFVAIALLIEAIVETIIVNLFPMKLPLAWRQLIRTVIVIPVLMAQFYKKTVLPENFLAAIRLRIKNLIAFKESKYFYWWLKAMAVEILLILGASLIHPVEAPNYHYLRNLRNNYGFLYMYLTVIFAPAKFEIILLGGVFNYLKRHNRVAAYIITSLLQKTKDADEIEILLSVIYMYIYEKTESLSIIIILIILEGVVVLMVWHVLMLFGLI